MVEHVPCKDGDVGSSPTGSYQPNMKLSTAAMVAFTIVALLIGIAFFTVAERKVLASLQRRRGPNVVGLWGSLQAIADGLKLAVKEVVLPNRANKDLFVLAPILTFGLRVTSWAVIPVDIYSRTNFLVSDISLLYLFAISSLGVYGIILSGWSSNSKYAFLGSLRSSAQMISYEIFLALIFLAVLLLVNSLNLAEIVRAQTTSWLMAPLLPLAVVFFISILAETNRAPFDLPEAEAEIVAGYNIEYSSMTFALFFLGEYGNMLVLSYMMALLFMGGWTSSLPLIPGSFIIGFKACMVAFMIIFVRGNFPRYRYDQLMSIGCEAFLPFTFALLIFFIGVGL
jgi:NADH-quinone oxidoreductase subunit H